MTRRKFDLIIATALVGAGLLLGSCSTTGSHNLKCTSTEVAPNTQPGSATPNEALQWFLRNGDKDLPRTGFERMGNSPTRYMYSDGTNQISVGALPSDKGKPRTWVVLMTYDCS